MAWWEPRFPSFLVGDNYLGGAGNLQSRLQLLPNGVALRIRGHFRTSLPSVLRRLGGRRGRIHVLVQFGSGYIELAQGDITRQEVDAIVNAANSHLAGGGGVDGAIHRAAGPSLKEQTTQRYPDGCPTGDAVVTDAGNLKAKHVIHAVGPMWKGGTHGEAKLLAGLYRRCLDLAVAHGCTSIAFPAISTGVYRYPVDQAADVSVRATAEYLTQHGKPLLVRFVLFDAGTYGAFARVLESMAE